MSRVWNGLRIPDPQSVCFRHRENILNCRGLQKLQSRMNLFAEVLSSDTLGLSFSVLRQSRGRCAENSPTNLLVSLQFPSLSSKNHFLSKGARRNQSKRKAST
jgi:hypothetical protein